MPLSAKDVRFTARRAGDGDPQIYPRLMKDRAILANIDVALQYFETMVGEQRRALDPEALVHFFGDYKVARGMVASIGRTYRYRTPLLEEVVSRTAWSKLQRAGVLGPGALRVLLWDAANEDRAGFLDGVRRQQVFSQMEGRFGLRPGQLDRLAALDAPEHAILTRLGQRPRPADVLAEYRRSAVAALLIHSERVELTLARPGAGSLDRLRALAEIDRVEVDLVAESGGGRIAMRGQPDAFGSLARQGRRVARFVARLLDRCGAQVEDGSATVLIRGRRGRLKLSGETLAALTPHPEREPWVGDGWDAPRGWDDAAIWEGIGPGQASEPGWAVRREPEPRAWEGGVVSPDLLVRPVGQDTGSGILVCLLRTAAQAARLAALLPGLRGGEPLLFAGPGELVEPLREAGGWTVELDAPSLAPIVAVVARRALAEGPLTPLGQPAATTERRRRRVA
ncbi:MAG: DUF790 family protein [Chloroflexi bacterium]|nr:DUF790 family protein [Chloroflexota bacterium]